VTLNPKKNVQIFLEISFRVLFQTATIEETANDVLNPYSSPDKGFSHSKRGQTLSEKLPNVSQNRPKRSLTKFLLQEIIGKFVQSGKNVQFI
jgi:hypothetical protein